METLIRVNNEAGIANIASLQIQIAAHRRTPLSPDQGAAVFNEIETLINSLMPLYRVPVPTLTNTEIRDLQDQLRIAEANNQTLQNRLIEAENINNDSDEVLADYRRQLNDARDINRALASMRHTEIPEGTPTVKIPDPEMFSGDKEKLRSFIVQLQLKTQTITDEQTRLRYAVSRLSGQAFDQVVSFVETGNIALANIDALIQVLESAFGDPNRYATAARKINSLRQGNRDFSTYYAEFQRYAADLNWNEPAKLEALRKGMSEELKRDMIHMPEDPETMQAFVTAMQRLDNRRRAFQQESRSYSRPAAPNPPTTTPQYRTATSPPEPMITNP